jgi:hypothetical protein
MLNGTINPNSSNGYVYFYWGTDPTMTTYNQYNWGSITPNNTTQPVAATISALATATTYYFQTVSWNTSNSSFQYGGIRKFATAGQ